MLYRYLDNETMFSIQSTAYNPPALVDRATRLEFGKEMGLLRDLIRKKMTSLSLKGGRSGADYYIPDDLYPTRTVVVEIVTPQPIREEVLNLMQSVVLESEKDYQITIVGADDYLKTPDGDLYPRFCIIVQSDVIFVCSEQSWVLADFGIKPSPGPS